MELVDVEYFPTDILIKYLPVFELRRCLSIKDLINCKHEELQKLISNLKILLKNSNNIKFNMNWNLDCRINDWRGVIFDDMIIKMINLRNSKLDTTCLKKLSLPIKLKKLILSHNNITFNKIKFLKLPFKLRYLNIGYNNISDKGLKILSLPSTLRSLDLENSNISEIGLRYLKLPIKLKELNLGYNNIGITNNININLPFNLKTLDLHNNKINDTNIETLILPPELSNLFIYSNNITILGVTKIILPPKLYKFSFFNNNINQKLYKKNIMNILQSPEGIKRYAHIQKYYDFKRCIPIYKEICRGLFFGKTDDPIFVFLKNIIGSKNIRENILRFFNPFV